MTFLIKKFKVHGKHKIQLLTFLSERFQCDLLARAIVDTLGRRSGATIGGPSIFPLSQHSCSDTDAEIFSTMSNKDKTMRSYPFDSPQAVSRLLALSVIIDGGGSPLEIAATYRLGILDYAGIQEDVFDQVLHEMCADLPTTPDGLVKVETEMIDQLLAEIVRPDLRLGLWKAMWQLVYADENLADAEIALLLRVTSTWGIEAGVSGSGQIADPLPTPDLR
jgi:uncharacterized tellurite resistance protein B-like protein